MDGAGMSGLDGFRAEVRAWLAQAYPEALRGPDPQTDPEAIWGGRAFAGSDDPQIVWMRRLAERGWTAPTWPREYGGGGLSADEARVLAEEMAAGGYRPGLLSFGFYMLGPVLMEFANKTQKQTFIPAIVRGELRWCQGYSEPGAGSDLASLQTRCEDQGDHWLINGSKIWTSYADKADWCFCLVRTDTATKHGGVSFILMDMRSPGIETRPINLISGGSAFCETFFTDVKVPKENMVGRLNGGWEIAKRLLQYERQSISSSLGGGGAASGGVTADLPTLAKRYVGVDAEGRIADPDLRERIVRNRMEAHSLRLTIARGAAEARAGGPSAVTSITKYVGADIAKEQFELMLEAMGQQGLGWEGEAFSAEERKIARGWLRTKANSIEGGTSEVNLNVVAKRVLGLPDPPRPR
jgi:alkylation response protein AidB-like acyl-CoA dehydrogenase